MRRFLLLLLCAVTVAQGAQKKISELDAATTVSTNVYAAVIVGDNATSTNYETMKMAAGLLLYGFMTNNTTLYFYMDGGVIKGYATNIASAQITSLDAAKLTGTIDTNRYSSQVLLLDQLNSQAEFELRLGWTLPTGGSGSSVTNTVVNTGTPIQYEVPMYSDVTGTNIIPSNISISSDGNTLTVPTEIIVGAGGTDSYWEFTEQTAPATPASGKVRVYVLADGKVYGKDDAGTATLLGNLSEAELEALLELTDLQGNIAETRITFTDITTGNSSTSNHGYLRKLSGTASQYLDGSGAWSTPSGGTAGITASASTTDATVATLWTNQLATGTSGYYKAIVTAAGDAATNVYNFTIEALVQNITGTSAFVETNNISILPSAGTNFTAYFDLSGSNTFLKFRGLASENVNIVGTNVLVNVITNGATASSWTPSSKSGLQFYVSADSGVYSDAGTTPAVADATVQQWNDQSGNTRNASQATSGSRPQYKTSIFGSKAGIRFSAAGTDFMSATGVGATIAGTDVDYGIVVIFKASLTNSTRPLVSIGGADADTLVEANLVDGFLASVKRDDGAGLDQVNSAAGAGAISSAMCVVYNHNGLEGNIFKDGVLTSPANDPQNVGATTTGNPLQIGFRVSGTSQYFDGDIGVILVYDSALDAGEVANVTAWAQANWGTP
jgi:hypothetical protein